MQQVLLWFRGFQSFGRRGSVSFCVRRIVPHEFSTHHFQPRRFVSPTEDSMNRFTVFVPYVQVVSAKAVIGPPSAFPVQVFQVGTAAIRVSGITHRTPNHAGALLLQSVRSWRVVAQLSSLGGFTGA